MQNIIHEKILDSKEKFDLLLQKANLKDYLKADPQQAGETSELSQSMSNAFFFHYFYAKDAKTDEFIEDIKYKVQYEAKKNIVLHGYEGCGKTTFINYWMNQEKQRHVVLQFDRYIRRGDELLATLVNSINDAINIDVYDNDAVVIKEMLKVYTTEHNHKCMHSNDIQNNFIYMFEKFEWLLKLMKDDNRNGMNSYMRTDIKDYMKQYYDISELLLFMVLWDVCYKKVNNLSSTCYFIFENLDTLYESSSLQTLVTELGVFRNNSENLFKELRYPDGSTICNPTQEYVCVFVMRDTTKAIFNEHLNSQKVSLYVPKKSLTFNYRIDKVLEKKAVYLENLKKDKPEIFNENCAKLLKGIHRIQAILMDEYVTDTIFTLFNNNFRKEFEILADIHVDEEKIFDKYMKLCSIEKLKGDDMNWAKYGSRCILFRNIFDLLNGEGFFQTLKRTDYIKYVGQVKYAINLSRLILLYLQNSYNQINPLKNDERENYFVSIEILVKDILKICPDSSEIAKALWEMYEFRKKNNWNHLITFDQMHEISYAGILGQVQAVEQNNYRDIEFGNVRITLAGVTYLEKVLTHFEYFAARNNKTYLPSLFTWEILEILDFAKLETYLQLNKNEITECCKRLMCFNKEVLSKILDFSGKNFLQSNFAHRKYYEDGSYKSMYHCERIVHAQITYMDAFRMYVFNMIDNCNIKILDKIDITEVAKRFFRNSIDLSEYFAKDQYEILSNIENEIYSVICSGEEIGIKCIQKNRSCFAKFSEGELKDAIKCMMNKYMIYVIQSYIMMFGIKNRKKGCTAFSDSTKYIVQCYEVCIKKIREEHYKNFDLEINQINGKKLLSNC